MMVLVQPRLRIVVAVSAVLALLAFAVPPSAWADPQPVEGAPATVTGDPLPTVQIDGVVWSQVVVGNTVFAGGNFTSARPAGAAPGTDEVTRTHLLAYDIRTGELNPDFAPVLNGQVLSVAKSPDGSRIFVGGEFTNVNGSGRWRVAAFDTATGTLIGSFAPNAGATVRVVTASDSAVYLGGDFQTVNGSARSRIAAVQPSNGALLPFNPSADASVTAMTLNPSGSLVVAGGRFTTLGGGAAYGMGAVDAVTGQQRPWAIESVVRNAGEKASINSLVADGDSVYGTGYVFGSGGNFEGTFRADGDTGAVQWLADCHGDHYSAFPQGGVVYDTGHAHYCANIPDGFSQSNPWTYYSSSAYTKEAVAPNEYNALYKYASFDGQPSPRLLHWYPVWSVGSFTGQDQAGWHVTGNDDYVIYGGEFTEINGRDQQGLVRFARHGMVDNRVAPQRTDGLAPAAVSVREGQVQLGWQATYDRDSRAIEYRVYRDFTSWSNAPVHTTVVQSKPWDRPTITFSDTGLQPGATHTYRIYAFDAAGNNIRNGETTITVASSSTVSPYGQAVLGSQPEHWWRMDDASGARLDDSRGSATAFAPATITGGSEGAIEEGGTAVSLDGATDSYAATEVSQVGPQEFSVEAWVKTDRGGRIVGYGDRFSGTSKTDWTDRHLYLSDSGRVYFGVNDGLKRTINSAPGFDDNQWHHVVGTLGPNGMRLYVDGDLVGARNDVTAAMDIQGHWRIGRDTLSNWTDRPGSDGFVGQLDEVAVYHRVLTADEVSDHFAAASGIAPPNQEPQAAFSAVGTGLEVAVDASASVDPDGAITSYDWDFGDGATGIGQTASHTYGDAGTYEVTLTVTDDAGATGTATRSVTVERPPNQAPEALFTYQPSDLEVAFDASASVDTDGSVASYAWQFGDGATGSGVTASHTYAEGGTYDVTLTVTDNEGATGSATVPVTVAEPDDPIAPFASDGFTRSVSDGWGSADLGGSWSVGGASAKYAVDGSAGLMTVPAAGRSAAAYLSEVSAVDQDLVFTFVPEKVADGGGTYLNVAVRGDASNAYRAKLLLRADGSVRVQLVRLVNGGQSTLATAEVPELSVAAGTQLRVRVQALGSEPTALAAKVWDAAGVEPAEWAVQASDATAALQGAGGLGMFVYVSGSATNAPITYRIDDVLAAGGISDPNQAPQAEFTATVDTLSVALDASASSDPDGSVTAYAWDFGDGSTGTGQTASHTYAAGGAYDVTLTVTDNEGATASTTQSVSVAPPGQAATFAADTFGRSVSDGWGSADIGGEWSLGGGSQNFAVDGSAGLLTVPAAGRSASAYLSAVSELDQDLVFTWEPGAIADGGGTYLNVAVRGDASNAYRAKLLVRADGTARIQLVRVINGGQSLLATTELDGLTVAAGSALRVRVLAVGAAPTQLAAKVWPVGAEEPDWSVVATDATAALQQPGGLGLFVYVSGSATNAPITYRIDDLAATRPE